MCFVTKQRSFISNLSPTENPNPNPNPNPTHLTFTHRTVSNTIVKLHGGKIGVTSDGEGQGSTFYIDIPISKIERGSNYRHTSPAHKDVSSKVGV